MLINEVAKRVLFFVFLVALGCVVLGGVSSFGQELKPLPSFKIIKEVVDSHFASLPGYKPGNIISRSEVKPLFEKFKLLCWEVSDRRAILDDVLADGSFLVVELRRPAGRRFMRRISKYPNAYDRLDRLSRLPHGHKTVLALINGKGGYEMIEYMTTSKGGIAIGKQLSNAPKGANFNKPTGRIYTVKILIDRLREAHAFTLKRRTEAALP